MINRQANIILYRLSIAVFALIVIIVTLLSLLPDPLPGLPNQIGLDKVLHFLAYLGLGLSLHFALSLRWASGRNGKSGRSKRWRTIIPVVIFALIYGGGIEFFQRFTGRSPEWMDLLADVAGGIAGASLSILVQRWLPGQKRM